MMNENFDFDAPDFDKMNAWEFEDNYKRYVFGILHNNKISPDRWMEIYTMVLHRLFGANCNEKFDAEKGKFRSYLGRLTEWAMIDWWRKENRYKRVSDVSFGGGSNYEDDKISLEAQDCEGAAFIYEQADWADEDYKRNLVIRILEEMKNKMRAKNFTAFIRYALNEEDVESVSRSLHITPNQIYLAKERGCKIFVEIGRRLRHDDDMRDLCA